MPRTRTLKSIVLAILVGLAGLAAAAPAGAVMLVDLVLDATARPYTPDDPPSSLQQQFSVPSGEGRLVMTYTEDRYVGGPGGFTLNPVDLSNEYLGWGGSAEYTPRNPIAGQPYKVEVTWRHSFSRKMWVATLTAHHVYQAFQIAGAGEQRASSQRLTVEFIPVSDDAGDDGGGAADAPLAPLAGRWDWGVGAGVVEIFGDGTGYDANGHTLTWVVVDAAAGVYELRWSHGYVDTAVISADGGSLVISNTAGARFTAARRPEPARASAPPPDITGSWNWGAGGGTVEIAADGGGHDARGNTMRWRVEDIAARRFLLTWSHGFTDHATLSLDGTRLAVVNDGGVSFTATRRQAP